jgi:hypothetical protein
VLSTPTLEFREHHGGFPIAALSRHDVDDTFPNVALSGSGDGHTFSNAGLSAVGRDHTYCNVHLSPAVHHHPLAIADLSKPALRREIPTRSVPSPAPLRLAEAWSASIVTTTRSRLFSQVRQRSHGEYGHNNSDGTAAQSEDWRVVARLGSEP